MSLRTGKTEAIGGKDGSGNRKRTISITKWNGDPNIKADFSGNIEDGSKVKTGGGGDTGSRRPSIFLRRGSVFDYTGQSVAERIRQVLKLDSDSDAEDAHPQLFNIHSLFTQLDVLVHFEDGQMGWKEIARWMKYEETVDAGDRWSKPHVPTAQMHSLTKLRKAFVNGTCVIGLGASGDPEESEEPCDVVDVLMQMMRTKLQDKISEETLQKIRNTFVQPHKHKHRKTKHHHHQSSAVHGTLSEGEEEEEEAADALDEKKSKRRWFLRRRSGDGKDIAAAYHNYPKGAKPEDLEPYKPNKHLSKKLPKNSESANILAGQVDFLTETLMVFCRLDQASKMQKADLTEVDIPTRFLFLILGPQSTNIWELLEIGRAMAALLNDKVFCEVAYHAKTRHHIVDGIDEFMDDLTVLPPSIWDPSIRLEPPCQTRPMDQILGRLDDFKRQASGPSCPPQEEGASDDQSLLRTGRFFGGLVQDIRHRYRFYLSDFKDALHIQCIASTVFLFFACITPIVTFGGLLGQKTDGYMGTMETLMSGAICGVLYATFAGQPLTIVGATGPLLIFESILYHLCKENGLDFMSFRFWIGAWVMLALLIIVAFDLSALVRYITRFTEESFAILISVIFIYEAFAKIAEIYHHSPVHTGVVREDPNYRCYCQPSDFLSASNASDDDFLNETTIGYQTTWLNWFNLTDDDGNVSRSLSNWTTKYPEDCITFTQRLVVRIGCISEDGCLENGWTLSGSACYSDSITHSVADVFFLSLILFLGTFALAIFFRTMRTSRYFPTKVRSMVADFAVLFSVISFTGIDYGFGLETPKLNVPAEFVTTRRDRGWLVNPGDVTYWWLIVASIVPAILATILVFLDQQITAVIINRKEHKLKKGHGYHLDLFVLAFLIFICSLLGLPWFVAATVRAITHVRSLIRESEVSVPGERPQMLGVRENRLTGICIHLLIGFSTLITGILRLIPMPVLYGVFLYMGITSLNGVQFIQRIAILFMPSKYQPDYIFLRHVKAIRVHCFTIVQLICFALMWVVKTIKVTSIAFPLMLVALMAARKVLDYVFTQSDLYWLDHLLPDEIRREKEDAGNRHENGRMVTFAETDLLRELSDDHEFEITRPLVKGEEPAAPESSLPADKV